MSSTTGSIAGDAPARTKIQDLSSQKLNHSYAKHKKSFSIKKSAHKSPNFFATNCSDQGIVGSVFKVLKSVFQYPAVLVSELPYKAIVNHCSGVADTFKSFNFFKGIKSIYDNRSNKHEGKKLKGKKLHLRNLGIAGGVFQTVIGGATFTKLLDNFGVIKIAEITSAMGRSSVAGQALAAVAPFSVVTNFLEIGQNIIAIAKASLIIHGNRKKKSQYRRKVRNLSPKNNKYEANVKAFVKAHIKDIETKQAADLVKLDQLAGNDAKFTGLTVLNTAARIDQKENIYQAKLDALNAKKDAVKNSLAVLRFFNTVAPKLQLRRARLDLFEAKETHDKICNLRTSIFNHRENREDKLVSYTKIDNDLEANGVTAPVGQLFVDKGHKWKVQSSGLNLKNFQEGIGIVINILAIITLLAATVLFFSGIATIPATLGITSMFLIISVFGCGNEFFKKYKKPKVVVVDVTKPKYAIA